MWANGNGGPYDDCAADGYASSIYTISVGAIGVDGRPSPFDEECSAKMVTNYVTDPQGNSAVVMCSYNCLSKKWYMLNSSLFFQQSTTDLYGQCTSSFGGTSAATPMASGIIALALEAK